MPPGKRRESESVRSNAAGREDGHAGERDEGHDLPPRMEPSDWMTDGVSSVRSQPRVPDLPFLPDFHPRFLQKTPGVSTKNVPTIRGFGM